MFRMTFNFTKLVLSPLECDLRSELVSCSTEEIDDCVKNLSILLITGIIAAVLLVLLVLSVLVLVTIICCMACKIKALKRSAEINGGDRKNFKGIFENPTYNDLPMSNLEATEQDANYHVIKSGETAVSYDTVPSTQLQAYDDVILSAYHVLGEDENMKNKVGKTEVCSKPSSTRNPKDNYDDVIMSNYDVVGVDENLNSQRKGKPPATPPPSKAEVPMEVLEYSVVTKGAKVVVKEGGRQMEYSHLAHHSASTSCAAKPPTLECYSRLCDSRKISSSVGELSQQAWQAKDPHQRRGNRTGAVRRSVDLNQLMESDGAEALYCNTASSQDQRGVVNPVAPGPEDEASLYMNVKH